MGIPRKLCRKQDREQPQHTGKDKLTAGVAIDNPSRRKTDVEVNALKGERLLAG